MAAGSASDEGQSHRSISSSSKYSHHFSQPSVPIFCQMALHLHWPFWWKGPGPQWGPSPPLLGMICPRGLGCGGLREGNQQLPSEPAFPSPRPSNSISKTLFWEAPLPLQPSENRFPFPCLQGFSHVPPLRHQQRALGFIANTEKATKGGHIPPGGHGMSRPAPTS